MSDQVTFVGAGVVGDVPPLEVVSTSDGESNCSSWSVVSGRNNGNETLAATTQQQVVAATQVRSALTDVTRGSVRTYEHVVLKMGRCSEFWVFVVCSQPVLAQCTQQSNDDSVKVHNMNAIASSLDCSRRC